MPTKTDKKTITNQIPQKRTRLHVQEDGATLYEVGPDGTATGGVEVSDLGDLAAVLASLGPVVLEAEVEVLRAAAVA